MGETKTVFLGKDHLRTINDYLNVHRDENRSSVIRKALDYYFGFEVGTDEIILDEVGRIKDELCLFKERININTEIQIRFFKTFYLFWEDYSLQRIDNQFNAKDIWKSALENLNRAIDQDKFWLEKTMKKWEADILSEE